MSNINNTVLQGMINAAKTKKEQSQAVIDNFNSSTQAQIDAARAEISALETQIAEYETQIEDFNAQLRNPPTHEVTKGKDKNKKVTTVVNQGEVNRIKAEKEATVAQLEQARTEVQAAQATAATAEQALADGPDIQEPGYAEAQKMFSVLSHLDRIIALRSSGQDVPDSELESLNSGISQAASATENMMGSEFVTKFWEDVEAGLIVLKDTDPNAVPDARAAVDAFFDAAAADENSTQRNQLNQINEILVDKYVQQILGRPPQDPNAQSPAVIYSLPVLLGQIGAVNSSIESELTILLEDAGFDTENSEQAVTEQAFEFLINEINDHADQGLLVADTYAEKGRADVEALTAQLATATGTERTNIEKVLALILKYNTGSEPIFVNDVPDLITDLSAENSQQLATVTADLASLETQFASGPSQNLLDQINEKRNELLVRSKQNNFWQAASQSTIAADLDEDQATQLKEIFSQMQDENDMTIVRNYDQLRIDALKVLFPNSISGTPGISTAEEIAFVNLKEDYALSEELGLREYRDGLTLLAFNSPFVDPDFSTINQQINEAEAQQAFWADQGEFWIDFHHGLAGIDNSGAMDRLENYANRIIGLQTEFDDAYNNEVVTTRTVDEIQSDLTDYKSRIQNIFDTGFEGHVGPPETEPLYNYMFNALLPDSITTEGPKISQMNQILALSLMETSLGGVNGTSLQSLLSQIAGVYGDTANAQGDYTGFTGDLQNYLEFRLYDTNNPDEPLTTEALVDVIDTLNDFTNNVTYLEAGHQAEISAKLAQLDSVREFVNARKDEIAAGTENTYTLPSMLDGIKNIFGDSGVAGSTNPNEQFTGFTGAIANSLSDFDIYDTEAPLTLSEVYTVLDNLTQVQVLFDYMNINNTSVNPNRSFAVYFAGNEYLDETRSDIDDFAAGASGLAQRIDAVKNGSSNESLEGLITEKNRLEASKLFAEATEEFWSYEKSFTYPPSSEENVLDIYMQIRVAEEDFYSTILDGAYDEAKMETLSTLKDELALIRGSTYNYQAVTPNINMIEQAIYSNVKFETLDQESRAIQQELDDLNSGNTNLSQAQIQRRISELNLGKSITEFKRDFWVEQNNYNQNLLTVKFREDREDELNFLLNKHGDLQRDIENLMNQLASNNQAARIARTQIRQKNTQLAGIKDQILALSI